MPCNLWISFHFVYITGTPSADNPIPGSGNSASSLLERLTASSATSGTNPPSPYTPLPSSSPNTQPFTSPSSKSQFLSQSPSPKNNQQQQQTHFPSPSPKPPATPSPLSSPPQSSVNLNLQGLSLASLQGAMASIPGLQNVQVSRGESTVYRLVLSAYAGVKLFFLPSENSMDWGSLWSKFWGEYLYLR